MSRGIRVLLVAVLVVPMLLLAACGNSTASVALASGIPEKLHCQCPCDDVFSGCESSCIHRANWLQRIGDRLEAGQSEAEILEYFVDLYGPDVLEPQSHEQPTSRRMRSASPS